MVELRGRLVVPGAESLAAVHGDDRALIRRQQDHVRVDGIDPDAVIVVAARRTAKCAERPAAVSGFPGDDAAGEDDVRVFRMDFDFGEIRSPGREALVRRHPCPVLAAVVRSIKAVAASRLDRGKQPLRHARRDGDTDAAEAVLGKRRQPVDDRPPRAAAVRRLEHGTVRAGEHAVLPRALAGLPQHGVDVVGVLRIEHDVGAAGVLVLVEHLLERARPVGRSEDPAFFVRPVRMSEHRHEQPIRIFRIDRDLRNLLSVTQAEVCPCSPGVRGFVDAIAGREVGTLQPFTAAGVDDVRVGWRNRKGADRSGGLIVENRGPDPAVVRGFPHTAVGHADIEKARSRRNAGRSFGAPAAKRPDHAPP